MPGEQHCGACGGSGVTEHTEHTVETDAHGNQTPVVRSWTGPCSTCHGSGSS
ncbi:hypothetical protein [Streptomyces sp. SCL15-4]|uniref:hypothetical protein n=1 Tax=Streptomyces sp. SCL15-4 TaxID=2967221 RepID=UPI002966F32A|nr:hypothetical protein [Streptomyces sp. SCL15-4]